MSGRLSVPGRHAAYQGRHRPAASAAAPVASTTSVAPVTGVSHPTRRVCAIAVAAGGLVAAVAVPAYALAAPAAPVAAAAAGSVSTRPTLTAPHAHLASRTSSVRGFTAPATVAPAPAAEVVTITQTPVIETPGSDFTDSALTFEIPKDNPHSAAQAVAWARAQAGNSGWYRQCLAFTAQAYGWGSSNMATALDQWNAIPAEMRHEQDRRPPVGALLFWDTGHAAGHVAIYLGGGQIASNDIVTPGTISIVPAGQIETAWHATYLGWTAPYYTGA